MNRSSLHDFFGLRGKARNHPLAFEPLEERRLLTSTYNLLVSTVDDTAGKSVVAYNESTGLEVAGGAYTGNHGLGYATGLAVAPDGSYYVSNLDSGAPYGGQVLHYNKAGQFLNVLGANDSVHAPLAAPGAMAFGPNGNLYVADLYSNAIFQFDVSSPTQQFQSAATLSLPQNFTPGGFTFAADGSNDLIVGGLGTQAVLRYHNGTPTTVIAAGSGIEVSSIIALANGDLLLADFDFNGAEYASHHEIWKVDHSTGNVAPFIDLSLHPPYGTGSSAGYPAQPLAMILDTDGNLLVGASPDHNGNGAILKFDINTGAPISTIVSGIGTPSGLALAPVAPEDLLIGNQDPTVGALSVNRFSTTSQTIVGGAATGDHGLAYTTGVAVAPDGSYYVSNLASGGLHNGNYVGQVLHYNSAGVFLNVLGGNDAVQAPIAAPGTLAFGPDGNLYVADLGYGAIYQFDVSSTTQQYQAAKTLQLPSGFTPGGFTFAPVPTHNLIVGNLNAQSVVEFDSDGATSNTPTTLVSPGSGYNPLAILALGNGDLLIADSDISRPPAGGHHQIVKYSAASGMTNTFITLTTPVDPSNNDYPPQPTSLLLDTDGNLLVGLSPDHTGDGAVEKFNISSGAMVSTVVSSIGTPAGLAFAPLQMKIPSTAWTAAGLTLVQTSDGMLHVYTTGTTTDAVSPMLAASVGGVEIDGLAISKYTLTIDNGGGNPIPSDGIAFVNGSTCSYAISGGTIGGGLTGAGSLTKSGPGTATLIGTNGYQGGTVVTGGKLVVTSVAGLADGSSLSVGANVATYFGTPAPAVPAEAQPAAATPSATVSAATAPVQQFVAASAALRRPAHDSALKSYNGSDGTARVSPSAAGYVAWWNQSSLTSDSSTNDRRAAVEAVMAEYGAS